MLAESEIYLYDTALLEQHVITTNNASIGFGLSTAAAAVDRDLSDLRTIPQF